MDEIGERKRKSFSGTAKAEVNKKMTEYIAAFIDSIIESQETKKRLKDKYAELNGITDGFDI